MCTQVPIAQIKPEAEMAEDGVGAQAERQIPQWGLASRLAFRFCFVYFGLFCLNTQILGGLLPIPNVEIPNLGMLWPMRQIVFWTAKRVFGVAQPLVYQHSGSGDKIFDWVLVFCLLVFAVLATAVWSMVDRKSESYDTLHKWFRLFIRFGLASQMLLYGMAKVVPLQMPFPYLTQLLEPLGNFSPMGVLWSSVGASPAYETFAGCAEIMAGILLVIPRTILLGAMVCLADSIQIFTLNMTYDVPVKLFSFHLILMCLFLLAPEMRRLTDFFLLNRIASASPQPQLFSTARSHRISLGVQVAFGLFLLGCNIYTSGSGWYTFGGGAPKSPLYGIWNVDQLAMDGQPHSPLLTDRERWRRVIFDVPDGMALQLMDDSIAYYGAAVNTDDKILKITKPSDSNWAAVLMFQRAPGDQLTLDGNMNGHKVHIQLHLFDRKKFTLVSRGFHWVQEYPFDR